MDCRRKKARKTPIVAPKDWQAIGDDALTMTVVFGNAKLRGGIDNDSVAKMQAMEPLPPSRRQKIIDGINKGIRANQHLDLKQGHAMLTGAALLALSSEMGEMLRTMPLGGAKLTYTITPKSTPNDCNWRLVVEP